MNFFVMSDDGQEVIAEIGEVSSVEIHSSFDEVIKDDDIDLYKLETEIEFEFPISNIEYLAKLFAEFNMLLKKLKDVFSSVNMVREKLPKPCKSIGEPHTKPLCRQFKDHRNSRKYWRR